MTCPLTLSTLCNYPASWWFGTIFENMLAHQVHFKSFSTEFGTQGNYCRSKETQGCQAEGGAKSVHYAKTLLSLHFLPSPSALPPPPLPPAPSNVAQYDVMIFALKRRLIMVTDSDG